MGEWGKPDQPIDAPDSPLSAGRGQPLVPPDGAVTDPSAPSPAGHPPAAPAAGAPEPAAHPGREENGGPGSDSPGSDGQVGAEEKAEGDGGPEPSPVPTRRGAREMAKVVKERDEYLDQLKRTRADFENYRKRISRQQMENLERATEGLIDKLLPVLDNFDAALAHGDGFEQVHGSFVALLTQEGLERVDPKGQPFDPNEADAVAHEEGDDGPVVAEVLRAGYKWKGRVLRPAMVRVRG